jgi:hypothetical protein
MVEHEFKVRCTDDEPCNVLLAMAGTIKDGSDGKWASSLKTDADKLSFILLGSYLGLGIKRHFWDPTQ